jgi:hypothetical protein
MATDTLCSYCQALRIDDSKYFTQNDELVNRNPLLIFEGRSRLPLAYRREDTYPDLPDLKSSADKGCAFCDILRTTILDNYQTELDDMYGSSNRLGLSYNVLIHDFYYILYSGGGLWDGEDYIPKSRILSCLTGSFEVPRLAYDASNGDGGFKSNQGTYHEIYGRNLYFDVEAEKGLYIVSGIGADLTSHRCLPRTLPSSLLQTT